MLMMRPIQHEQVMTTLQMGKYLSNRGRDESIIGGVLCEDVEGQSSLHPPWLRSLLDSMRRLFLYGRKVKPPLRCWVYEVIKASKMVIK